ncbi:glycosyltransferase family 2 protein [Hymenobacter caeli]|uniref:Dolichol-phosphate mannosyltransferase n=1 Tax=Hymenobacter caeli TaxID=2735894 RepID=A0ABX2FJI5_9BACT|nr:glycosyltransferase family 2 protein [Hymenobacter caeli]NRT17280.1 dolichol-phosphate mannosyltransferase [Hymenobacter caeli]
MPPPTFSFVSPVYRAESLLAELVRRLVAAGEALGGSFEIVLVDDRSADGSWAGILALAAQDPRVRGLRLSRNFGQHRAITAGLERCRGEWVVVLDCDLQDRPEEIPALYARAQAGYDLVLARRTGRQDAWGKKLVSRLFYRVLSYLTEVPQDPAVANFGIYHRRVIAAVLAMRESIRYFPTMVRWVGFRAGYLDVAHAGRARGPSSYRLSQRLHLGLDVLLANSDKPLRLTVKAGLLLAGGAFLLVPVTLLRYWAGQIDQPGYTSLIISIWFFSGLLLAVLGMVGLYIGKTFEQVKNRPLYIEDEATGN